MTSNTSPEKPDWFALIEKDAPSAQVRTIDKKIPALTGFLAITIVAMGTFFANGSINADSALASNSATTSINPGTSVNTVTSAQVVGKAEKVKVAGTHSINKIADPTPNGGGDHEDDDDVRDHDGDRD
jgi:hypothetical protein